LVLSAYSFGTETLKIVVIPQNWIVDPDGIIRLKGIGSPDSIEKWEPGMKDAIEKVHSSGTTPRSSQ